MIEPAGIDWLGRPAPSGLISKISGLPSQRVAYPNSPGYAIPGSRNARVSSATIATSPNWSVGAVARPFSTRTSMPSKRSSSLSGHGWSWDGTKTPGAISASSVAAGNALPEESMVTVGPVNSVMLKYSATVAVTSTWSPTCTAGGVPV